MGEGLKYLMQRVEEQHHILRRPIGNKTISRVVYSFFVGDAYKAASMSTDGEKLYSYGLCIGETIEGAKVIYNHTAADLYGIPSRGFKSMTTSKHVRIALDVKHDLSNLVNSVPDGEPHTANQEDHDSEGGADGYDVIVNTC